MWIVLASHLCLLLLWLVACTMQARDLAHHHTVASLPVILCDIGTVARAFNDACFAQSSRDLLANGAANPHRIHPAPSSELKTVMHAVKHSRTGSSFGKLEELKMWRVESCRL